jgi:hypothetical protein
MSALSIFLLGFVCGFLACPVAITVLARRPRASK